MDPKFQTSFIPKKPISQSGSYGAPTIGIFPVISTIIFVLAVLVAGGLFGYEIVLKDQIGGYQTDLERARAEFDPEKIEELMRLDKRIETTKNLLSGHLSVSKFFKLLESNTLKTVRFTDFDFSFDSAGAVKIVMVGQANSFSSIALQADRFNSNSMFKDTIVDSIELEEFGTVSFRVTTSVHPSVVSYKDTITTTQSGVESANIINTDGGLEDQINSTPVQENLTNPSGVIQEVVETPIDTGGVQNQQTQ